MGTLSWLFYRRDKTRDPVPTGSGGSGLTIVRSVLTACSGAWLIHPVLIIGAKLLVDAIPRMKTEVSWTIVNIGYMVVSIAD